MDLYERIMELGSMGYHCSQIIMIMTLETIGEENPQLVKAMGGLGGGIGYCGDTCGCLTGSACAIGYFLGNLAPEEKETGCTGIISVVPPEDRGRIRSFLL